MAVAPKYIWDEEEIGGITQFDCEDNNGDIKYTNVVWCMKDVVDAESAYGALMWYHMWAMSMNMNRETNNMNITQCYCEINKRT